MLDELRTTLDDPYANCPWRKRPDVRRLVKQLQTKRKQRSLRNKYGKTIFDPETMAAKIATFWQTTMQCDC